MGIDVAKRAEGIREKAIGETYCDFILQEEKSIDQDALCTLAEWVAAARRVYCMGFYISNLPARFLSVALRALHNVEAENPEYDYLMRQYHDSDLIILFSVRSGEQYRDFLKGLAKLPNDKRPRIVLVTMNPKHVLRAYCDSTIVLPSADSVGRERLAIIDNMLCMMFNEMLLTKIGELGGSERRSPSALAANRKAYGRGMGHYLPRFLNREWQSCGFCSGDENLGNCVKYTVAKIFLSSLVCPVESEPALK